MKPYHFVQMLCVENQCLLLWLVSVPWKILNVSTLEFFY